MTGLGSKGLFFCLDKFYPLDMSYQNSAAKIALFFNPASQIAKTFVFALILPFLSLLFPGCGSDDGKEAPDVSHIPIDIQVKRFDQDIFAMDTAQMEAEMRQMANKYPDLFPLFTVNIIHDQTNPKELPDQALRANNYAFIDYLWRYWTAPDHRDEDHIAQIKTMLDKPVVLSSTLGYYRAMLYP